MQPFALIRSLSVLSLLAFALTGCSSVYVPSFIQIYKPDIAQGNILESKQVDQVKVGMDRSQVNQLLGTPALKDIFHHNQRETYVFYDKRGKNKAFQHVLVVLYDTNGRVDKIEQQGTPLDQAPAQDFPEALRAQQAKKNKAKSTPEAMHRDDSTGDAYSLTPPGSETGLGTGGALQPGGGL